MTPQGSISCPASELDVGLCVSNGMVFRWRPHEGGWLGADGFRVLWVRREGDALAYATFPEPGREDWVREFFRLDVRLADVERRVTEAEPELAPLVASLPGLRVLRRHDAEECLLSFLCSVNNHIPRITAMIARLCDALGEPAALGLRTFPPARAVVEAGEERLRALGFGYRARTLGNAARALLEKPDGWLAGLRGAGYDKARAELMTLPGVGRKVADCVCLFGLWHDEAVPVDTHLWKACCERYFPEWRGKSMTEARYEAVAGRFRDRFGASAGWAHQYVFYGRLLTEGSRKRRVRARPLPDSSLRSE